MTPESKNIGAAPQFLRDKKMNDDATLDGGDRRKTWPLSMRELEDHIDDRIKKRLAEHTDDEAKRFDKRFEELKDLLKSAFPGGDPEEHRRYHNEVIEYIRERRDLFRSIREKSLTGVVWMMLLGLGAAVWNYIKIKLLGP